MACQYRKDNIVYFKVNDIEYGLHKFIIKEMDIFSSIYESFDTDQEIKLQHIDATEEIMECIFDILTFGINSQKNIIVGLPLYIFLRIVTVMRYLLIKNECIWELYNVFTSQKFCDGTIGINFPPIIVSKCIDIPYCYEMFHLITHLNELNIFLCIGVVDISNEIINKIINNVTFPISSKHGFIKFLIKFDLRFHSDSVYIDRGFHNRGELFNKTIKYGYIFELYNLPDQKVSLDEIKKGELVLNISDKIFPIKKEFLIPQYIKITDILYNCLDDYLKHNSNTIDYDIVCIRVPTVDIIISHIADVLLNKNT
jgi:hypothetical protein